MTVNLVAAVCFGVVALGSPAAADCDKPRSAVTALKRADVVFRGKVRDIRTHGKPSSVDNPGWRGWIVTFDVSHVWKGSVEQHFVLHNVEVAPDDAFRDFERGSEYLCLHVSERMSRRLLKFSGGSSDPVSHLIAVSATRL